MGFGKKQMTKNTAYKLIGSLVVAGAMLIAPKAVFADECEPQYGGGEICLVNKRFEIVKEVRLCDSNGDNCSDWKDKVTGVEENDEVQFRIRIKNLSDEEASEVTDFDNMKMKDDMPSEMHRTGGDGLTEYWDDFDPGDTKTFIIDAEVNDSEYDTDVDFEKCVVNKASVYWDGKFEGADTATVCYGNAVPTELPQTGASGLVAVLGLGLTAIGAAFKKVKKALHLETK